MKMKDKKGQTMAEMLISIVIICILFASSIGAFLLLKNIQNYVIAEYNLQRDANTAMNRMIRNAKEASSVCGLRSAVSFTIPSAGRIDYIDTGGKLRSYYLSGNAIIYQSPTHFPNTDILYAAPAGSNLTLRFWEPSGYTDHETVGIYIGVTQQIGDRPISGSVSTYVNLRNVPK